MRSRFQRRMRTLSKQLEVIRFRDLLEVGAIAGFVEGVEAPTIDIRGDDFSSAAQVLVNGQSVPEFMIVNKQTIFAQLPEGTGVISTIQVVSTDFTKTILTSKIFFEIGQKTRAVEGILKLVQLFTKWLLQTPGSDIFDPSRGGGLQEIVGKVLSSRKMEPIFASLSRAIDATSSQMRIAQGNQPNLPVDERLLAARLIDVNVFEAQMEARARISLESVAGQDAITALQL